MSGTGNWNHDTIAHLSTTNQARRKLTSLIETNVLPLRQTATLFDVCLAVDCCFQCTLLIYFLTCVYNWYTGVQ